MRQQVLLPPLPSEAEGKSTLLVHGFEFLFNKYDNSPYFEVIRVLQGQKGLIVSAFSSKTWTWRTKDHKLSFSKSSNILNLTGVGVRCNGSLHWLCSPLGVVGYNVKKETFSLIKLTDGVDGKLLKESEGCLFYIEITKYYICRAWILSDYSTKTWSSRYLVDIENLPLDVILPIEAEEIYSRILGFDPLDSNMVFVRINRRIVCYNLESWEVKEIHRLQEDEVEGFDVCPYKVMDSIPEECYSKVLRTPCGSQKKLNMGRTRSIGKLRFISM